MILVDSSEPENIIALLEQSAPVTVMPLNQSQRSDYYFGGEDGKTRQFNRVQAGELLGNIDSMEDELRRYYNSADENYQIIEGLISAVPLTRKTKTYSGISIRRQARPTSLFSCSVAENGYIYGSRDWNVSSAMFYAWIFRLDQAGISTFYTENYIGTVRLLAAIYNNCQKPPEEHTTLNRYVKPRIVIKEQNPMVKALMALSLAYQIGIGEDRATKIAEQYGSLFDVAMAEVSEITQIEGIGKKTAEKLLSSIGREL